MDLAELLQAGEVSAFNLARQDIARVDLFAADLPGVVAQGANLDGANLDKADLTGADLSDGHLHGASLVEVDGIGLRLKECAAIRLRLKHAQLDEAVFDGSDLTQADFSDASLEGASFVGTQLAGAKFRGAQAARVRLTNAHLNDALLNDAALTEADLSGSDLTGARLQDCSLGQSRLDGAILVDTRLIGSRMSGASLRAVRATGALFARVDLSSADLSDADLGGAQFQGANLSGAKLCRANLADAVLVGADLTGADLTDADFRGQDLDDLGLSEAQRAQVARSGLGRAPEDPPQYAQLSCAPCGEAGVALAWIDRPGTEAAAVRWAVFSPSGDAQGHLDLNPAPVFNLALVSRGDHVELLVVRDHAGLALASRVLLGPAGRIGSFRAIDLGFRPIDAVLGGQPWWAINRRGPGLVAFDLVEAGISLVRGFPVPTALGFLGKRVPVVSCKGDVVQVPDGPTMGAPRRLPPQFTGDTYAVDVDADNDIWLAWGVPREGRHAGSLKLAHLGRRGPPRVDALARSEKLIAIDLLCTPRGVHVAWTSLDEEGDQETWWLQPGARAMAVPVGALLREVHLVPSPAGVYLVGVGMSGELLGFDGRGPLAWLG